jgi:hypothetical protein
MASWELTANPPTAQTRKAAGSVERRARIGCPSQSGAGGLGLPSSGGAQQSTQATRHPEYVSATSYAAERMLGEPTTPLLSISDFISLEPYQARAFDTSAASWRSSTSLGSSVLRNTLLFVMPADVWFFSFPL